MFLSVEPFSETYGLSVLSLFYEYGYILKKTWIMI